MFVCECMEEYDTCECDLDSDDDNCCTCFCEECDSEEVLDYNCFCGGDCRCGKN